MCPMSSVILELSRKDLYGPEPCWGSSLPSKPQGPTRLLPISYFTFISLATCEWVQRHLYRGEPLWLQMCTLKTGYGWVGCVDGWLAASCVEQRSFMVLLQGKLPSSLETWPRERADGQQGKKSDVFLSPSKCKEDSSLGWWRTEISKCLWRSFLSMVFSVLQSFLVDFLNRHFNTNPISDTWHYIFY